MAVGCIPCTWCTECTLPTTATPRSPSTSGTTIVTEYGIADVRGKADAQIIEEILKITDSRFQDELIGKAKRHGKLAPDFELAPEYRQNYPERLQPC